MRTNYSIKNSITSIISNIISYIFLFIGQTLFIKILGVEYTGLNGLFSNILTILSLFELGIGSAITYNLYKCVAENDKEKIKTLMRFYKKLYNIVALTVFIVGILILPFLKYIIKQTNVDININVIYILFLISTVSTYIMSYKRNILFAHQRDYIINIIHVFCLLVLNVFQILIIYITKNYYLYLIIKIICILLENIIISIKVNKDYKYIVEKDVKEIDINTKKNILNKIKALFIHKVSEVVTTGTDNVLISMFFGIRFVGLYTSYNYIISSIKILFSSFIKSTSASVGNLLVENDYDKNYLVFKKIKFLNFWIAIFTSTCLLLLIEPFISIWIGKKYLLSKFVLIVLIINFFRGIMRNVYIVFKDAAGIWVEDKIVPLIQILLNIISSIILLKIFGLAGVFMGTIVSSLVLWLYSYPKFIYKKLFNKNYFDYFKELFKNIVIAILIVTSTYLISNLFVINSNLIKIFINVIICLIVPNLILYLLFRKTDEFKYYIHLIKNIFRRKKV